MKVLSEQVLLYGLLFAVILGAFYLATGSAIDNRADLILDTFSPLPDPGEKFSVKLRRRNDLVGHSSVVADRGAPSEQQS